MSIAHRSHPAFDEPIPYEPDTSAAGQRLNIVNKHVNQPKRPEPVVLFQLDDLEAARRYAKSLDKETGQRLESILSRLASANRWRPLTAAVSPNVVMQMKRTFPNFAEIIEEVAMHLVLARLNGAEQAALRLPPMLLVGPPGVGKSYFSRTLSEVLGTRFQETSLGTNTAGFILSGLDMSWTSGKPGMVFNTLLESPEANPMILLDEIDKANVESRSDPLGPLYSLLEPGMAKHFRDEAVTLPVDASHIIWIATANDTNTIPEPLLSRMTVFEIRLPSANQSAQIARGIWRKLRETQPWGRFLYPNLAENVLEKLQGESPRVIGKQLTRAAGHAILNKRQSLQPEDIKFSGQATRRIGF
jgi:ATP-dependent Lon protease